MEKDPAVFDVHNELFEALSDIDTTKEEDKYRNELIEASEDIERLIPGLKFIKPLSGAVPVTAEFEYQGTKWYFRSRYESVWFIPIDTDGELVRNQQKVIPVTTEHYAAGCLNAETYVAVFTVFFIR